MANERVLWAVALTIFALANADVSTRDVHVVLYPDCAHYKSCKEEINLNASASNVSFPNVAYVHSASGDDVLHFVMSTVNIPSFLMLRTTGDKNAKLNFDWDRLLLADNDTDMAGAVSINDTKAKVVYKSALAFTRLIEYEDLKDSASLTDAEKDNNTKWYMRDFSEFFWMNVTQGQGGKSVIFNTTYPQPIPYGNISAGSMYFEFEINNGTGRDDDLPRLIFNANNTQMNFALDQFVPNSNKSRFALEMTFIAPKADKNMTMEETKSIDDEFSPGVFRLVNWYTGGKVSESAYLQYKPVCYLAKERARDVGTEVMKYDLQDPNKVNGTDALLKTSLAYAYFGHSLNNTNLVRMISTNVSFGLSQDGFYLKNNYTVWTASFGYGTPPEETISTLVIVIIAAGLGLPVVLIIFGGIFVCVRRRRNGYEELSNGRPGVN